MSKKIISIFLTVLMFFMTSFATLQASEQESIVNNKTDDISIKNNEISVTGSNSVGNLVSNAVASKVQEQEENNGYNIFSVNVTDNQADVSFEIMESCTLVVGIYDESGSEMIATGNILLFEGETEKTIEIETKDMPQYFYVRAFLIDTDDMTPLCTVYETPNYTQELQQFFSMTTDDFNENQVLNFDDDKTNNFAVYGENTKIIEQAENINVFVKTDEKNGMYVIENADDSIKNLRAGDIFAYEYNSGEVLIVKVGEININNENVTITGAPTTLDEVFECVKINGSAGTEKAVIDASGLEEGVTYNGLVENEPEELTRSSLEGSREWSQNYSINKKIGSGSDTGKISGGLNFKIEASAEINITLNYQYIELKLDYKAGLMLEISGNAKGEIPLTLIGISPVSGVIIEVRPSFIVEMNITLKVDGSLEGVVGFQAIAGDGIKNITTKPKFTSEIKTEGTLYIGISLEPRIKIIHENIAEAKIDAQVGLKATAKPAADSSDASGIRHQCNICIDGEILFKASLSFEVKFVNAAKLKFKMLNIEEHLLDFYYSVDKGTFGWTKCPDIKNETYIGIRDEYGNPVKGAVIRAPFSVIDADGNMKNVETLTTDDSGKVIGYLSSGSHTITIIKKDYKNVEKKINISPGRESWQLTLRNKDKEAGSGNMIDILSVRAYKTQRVYEGIPSVMTKVVVYLRVNYRPEVLFSCLTGNMMSPDSYDECTTYAGDLGTGTISFSMYLHRRADEETDNQIEVDIGFSCTDSYDDIKDGIELDKLNYIPVQTFTFSEKNVTYGQYKEIPITVKSASAYSTYYRWTTTYDSNNLSEYCEEFNGLVPNNTYNFYVMKSRENDAPLSSNNLLYISQAVADENGNLDIKYVKERYDGYDAFVVGAEKKDIGDADVIIENLIYNGQEQYVNIQSKYAGDVMEEGKDYNITGDYSATKAGEYTVTLKGLGDYCGSKTITYSIIEENKVTYGDINNDGTIDTQDAVLIKKYLAGYKGLDINLDACDVNADGDMTSADAVLLLKHLAGYNIIFGEK